MRATILVVALCLATAANAQRTLYEWRFDTPEAVARWQPNQDVINPRVEDGKLLFHCDGSDPILVYQPPFEVPARPMQAIEVTMKASRDGMMQIFWSGTTEGPYGGFAGDKSTTFSARGDNQWHTYRVLPFWQKEGKIVRLRVDPYDGADFALESVKIVDYQEGAPTSVARFDLAGSAAGWRGISGAEVHSGASGLTIATRVPDSFAVAPAVDVDPTSGSIVCASIVSTGRMAGAAASQPGRATLLFATSETYGLRELPFPVICDGKPHTYNLDLMNVPDWAGHIVALGLRAGGPTGGSLVLRSLSLGAQPQGPPDLRALWFGIEDALPRAGVPVTVVARVTNSGGLAAKGVTATLTVPAGARVARSARLSGATARLVRFGQEEEWRWQVVFDRPTRSAITLRVASANAGSLAVASTSVVTKRAAVAAASYVPTPHPVRGKYDVGVYYFPGWKSASQWAPIQRFPERRPVLGWYREGDPQVVDWQIKWAVEHGITFFAYDWYWNKGARSLEHGLHDAYLKSRYKSMLKFCLLWANHNPPNSSSLEDSVAVTRYWIDNYFKRPEYYRIDDKPVVIIFAPSRYRQDMGSKAVHDAFDAMRDECRKAGLPGLYLIACIGSSGEGALVTEEGYDAVTCYNWAGLGMQGSERWSPYTLLTEGYRRYWELIAERVSLPQMIPISGGWDNRAWAGDAALVRFGRNPENFKKHLQDGAKFIETHPGKALPVALIEAWNEFGEGSYIEPQREYGFGYLDAIRDVFTTAPKAHADVIPADVGLSPPQVQESSPSRGAWIFARDTQGWDSGMDCSGPTWSAGALRMTSTGNDPAFFSPPMQVAAEGHTSIRIRMRMTALDGTPFTDVGQVFWATRSTAISEGSSVRFPSFGDGKWHEYTARVDGNPRWRGMVTQLRFDPCNRTGVKVEIARIEAR